ncbi:nucleoside-diphosphate-sugar epimerase [Actinoalloteichus hoggarensis]|uniref:NAD dependent epimerase/dehydratase family protein n=1 Tax=Actinoalloteichus hoggarensis TaxID=1470176 RepID=A0A221W4B6_9PSEU|nr:NAD-dependent epimerase/dehydratase family protein [Actinoalloteichus hoggarensis]ASO20695.1 NAD dependent epimerase/dehydratase family protein [Actinoalloteichus hoggarensis]MBB5924452.1 nucleoside-diphosphate-sugar epimerase [Actinoalloteichus hoggarensis]
MTPTALVVGGTGQVGTAMVEELVRAGYSVSSLSRGRTAACWSLPAGEVREIVADREELRAHCDGVDVLIDCVAGGRGDARQLGSLAGSVGAVVALSTAAVYRDDDGNTIETALRGGPPPLLARPLRETDPTVSPDGDSYAAGKRALEEELLATEGLDATILRPGAVHGPHGVFLREWYFVRRALDRRKPVVLAHRGMTPWHTTAVDNLAALARFAAERPGSRVLNAGESFVPTVRDLVGLVADRLAHGFDEVLLDGGPTAEGIGASPWTVCPEGLVLDIGAAAEWGFTPPREYSDAMGETVDSMIERARAADPRLAPILGGDLFGHHDYELEDRWLAEHGRKPSVDSTP